MKKKLFVTGSLVASALVFGNTTALAATANVAQHTTHILAKGIHRQLSEDAIESLASEIGISASELKNELSSGMKLGEILEAHGITKTELKKIFGARKGNSVFRKIKKGGIESFLAHTPSEMLQAEASVLGMSVSELKKNIEAHKSPKKIAGEKGMSSVDYRDNLRNELELMIEQGEISGAKVNFYNKLIQRLGTKK